MSETACHIAVRATANLVAAILSAAVPEKGPRTGDRGGTAMTQAAADVVEAAL